MRILEVNDVAGTATLFREGLQQLGHQVELYQPTVGTYRRPAWFRALIPAIRALESLQMRRRYRVGRFERLHVHYETFGVMPLLARLPYYLHCHGGMTTHMNRPLSRRLIEICLRRATRVLCATPNLLQPIQRYRPDVVFVPNPVDTEMFTPASAAGPSSRFRIFSISKMDTTKGWDVILPVLRELARQSEKFEVFAFGFGTEPRETILHRVALLRQWGIQVLSRLDRKEMSELIRSSDLVLGQFQVGAVGVSELEALACGRAVCCRFDYDLAYEERPPFLVGRSSAEVLALIDDALANRTRLRALGERGRDWVVRNHSVDAAARRLQAQLEA